MDENNTQEEKEAVYGSEFLMSKNLYYDFCSVSYNKTKKMFLTFLCLVTPLLTVSLLMGKYDIAMFYGFFISFLMIIIYFRTKKTIKIGYERMLISEGKERKLKYELFEDRIVAYTEDSKREYFYHQITKFFETKNFILLHLQHNLYISIEKNSLNASVDEVKSFLIEKCTLVKKKKFVDTFNAKKWSLIFLIAMIVVSVIGAVFGIVLKSQNLF